MKIISCFWAESYFFRASPQNSGHKINSSIRRLITSEGEMCHFTDCGKLKADDIDGNLIIIKQKYEIWVIFLLSIHYGPLTFCIMI